MRKIVTCVIAILFALAALAQAGKGKVTVTVLNEQKQPVDGATVELLRSKDSLLTKTALTDKNGVAEMENMDRTTKECDHDFNDLVLYATITPK